MYAVPENVLAEVRTSGSIDAFVGGVRETVDARVIENGLRTRIEVEGLLEFVWVIFRVLAACR